MDCRASPERRRPHGPRRSDGLPRPHGLARSHSWVRPHHGMPCFHTFRRPHGLGRPHGLTHELWRPHGLPQSQKLPPSCGGGRGLDCICLATPICGRACHGRCADPATPMPIPAAKCDQQRRHCPPPSCALKCPTCGATPINDSAIHKSAWRLEIPTPPMGLTPTAWHSPMPPPFLELIEQQGAESAPATCVVHGVAGAPQCRRRGAAADEVPNQQTKLWR